MLFERKFLLSSTWAAVLITACLAQSQNPKTSHCEYAAQVYGRASLRAPRLQDFSPPGGSINKCMVLDLDDDGVPETVFSYSVPDEVDGVHSTTIKILKYESQRGGWKTVFEKEGDEMAGHDWLDFESLKSSSGADGVLVLSHLEGTGTATYWYAMTMVRNKVVILDPTPARKRTLEKYGYVDYGDSSVSWMDDLIVWKIIGYSGQTAHCCPDKPSLQMTFRFTGTSISLQSVKQLPPGS